MPVDEQELYKFMGAMDARVTNVENSIRGFGARLGEIEKLLLRLKSGSFNGSTRPIVISGTTGAGIGALLVYLLQLFGG